MSDEDKSTAELLAEAEADGLTLSLAGDGRVVINGTQEAQDRWRGSVSALPLMEVAGVVLGGFVFSLARSKYLDGQEGEFAAMLGEAAASGIGAARREQEIIDEHEV